MVNLRRSQGLNSGSLLLRKVNLTTVLSDGRYGTKNSNSLHYRNYSKLGFCRKQRPRQPRTHYS